MADGNILIVENDPEFRELMRFNLAQGGFEVVAVADCLSARARIARSVPDLLLLDAAPRDMTGLQFVEALRRDPEVRGLRIVLMGRMNGEERTVAALEAGADDYLVKPVPPRELEARVRAQLRRPPAESGRDRIGLGALSLDTAAMILYVGERPVRLGPQELKLLEFLMRNPGPVFSRSQLISFVWGPGSAVGERTVDVHVRRLRQALGQFDLGWMIETVYRVGYRMTDTPSSRPGRPEIKPPV
ncbi:MAG: winged helix-turn-helix domain-containing protein [Gammaproteobacteria bacterium]